MPIYAEKYAICALTEICVNKRNMQQLNKNDMPKITMQRDFKPLSGLTAQLNSKSIKMPTNISVPDL